MKRTMAVHEAGHLVLDESLVTPGSAEPFVKALGITCEDAERGCFRVDTDPPLSAFPTEYAIGSVLAGAAAEAVDAGQVILTLDDLRAVSAHGRDDFAMVDEWLRIGAVTPDEVTETLRHLMRLLGEMRSYIRSTAERLLPILAGLQEGQTYHFDRDLAVKH